MNRITLNSLQELLLATSITETYHYLNYDYADEVVLNGGMEPKRKQFLDRFSWIGDCKWMAKPGSKVIFRLFNQINTFYAERFLSSNTAHSSRRVITEINRLCLFRQGKRVGLRSGRMLFGTRVHLPFGDSFKGAKWLYGVEPDFLEACVAQWCETADLSISDPDVALALMMTFIGIHPFSDGNGRVARLVFTWLRQRAHLQPLWLAEGDDGELLRTGTGIQSTEYLMAMFVMKIAGEHNVVDPGGWRDDTAPRKMADAIKGTLLALCESAPNLFATPEFQSLKSHLHAYGHFRPTSPRFECLRDVLATC